MNKYFIRSVVACVAWALLSLFSSCSSEDYLNAIPDNSTALVAVDAQALIGNNGSETVQELLKIDDLADCGLDLSAKLYLFETVDGNIGLSAKIADDKKLIKWFDGMSKEGFCKTTSKYKDYQFTIIKDSWVAGFSDNALVVMGPTLPAQQQEVKQNILKLLGQDADEGIKGTPMFDRLDSINAPVAFVAQAAALPEKFVAPFTIGAPKDADLSQVMIAAELGSNDGNEIIIRGETFSFNAKVDKELKSSSEIFRPITGKYNANMSSGAVFGMFLNVEGAQFIKLLHNNKTFQALLVGMNTAIDMDNIIKSIDGDVVVVLPKFTKEMPEIQMCADLKSKTFLNDVGYWKQSCPAGSKIVDWEKDSYYYSGGDMTFYFGVSEDMQFFSGSSENEARNILNKAADPLSVNIQELIKGQRMAMVLNLDMLLRQDGLGSLANSLLNGKSTIVYIMK